MRRRTGAILLAAVTLLLLDGWFLTPLSNNEAAAYLDESIALAAATYGTCRVVNAGVSVLQESNVSFAPLGLGLELHLGEMLDPINDATERLATLSVSAMGVLGAQRLILFTATELLAPVFWLLIVLSAAAYAGQRPRLWPALARLLVAVALIKLSIPLMCGIGIYTNTTYFDPHIQENLTALSGIRQHASQQYDLALLERGLASRAPRIDASWYDLSALLTPWLEKVQSLWLQTQAVYRSTTAALSYVIDHFEPILASFGNLFVLIIEKVIIQVFLLPLITLWCLRQAHKWIFGEAFDHWLRSLLPSAQHDTAPSQG